MVDPKTGRFLPQQLEPRFWAKVDKQSLDECWLWRGGISQKSGYGVFWVQGRGGESVSAHRMSWELHNGPIPDRLFVLHKCDVRPCVNPGHLFLGTQTQNMQDCIAKGRHCGGLTQGFYTKPERRAFQPKLNPEKVREIRMRVARGERLADVAKLFSVQDSTIHGVVHRRIYKHVD